MSVASESGGATMTPEQVALGAVADAKTIYEHAASNSDRNLQTIIGPSELGTGCDRCLIHKLAATPEIEPIGAPWLPVIGTATHEWAEMVMVQHLARTRTNRWIPEARVKVGQVNGVDIWGTCDLFDAVTGTVIDLKCVGTTTLKKVKADGSGTSTTYRNQIQLYGKGIADLGYTVRAVAVLYLPRNGLTLAQGRTFTAAYDEQVALRALARATQFAQWITAFGAEQVLTGASPHTGQEFSCQKYADSVAAPAATVTADTFLSV